MANQNRQTLKQYFQTGNTPTQDQFADLIDSGLNQVDDSITCDTKSGNVGIGTNTPSAKLEVAGKVIATELAGDGSALTNLNAANLEGNLKLEQLPALTAKEIPDLPASKITSGQLTLEQLPALTAEQIPDLPASKITTGQLTLDRLPALTPAQIPDLPASKITGLPVSPDNEWIEELQHAISVQHGQVAIGPAPPSSELVISTDVSSGLGPVLTLVNGSGGAGAGAAIDFDGWNIPPQLPSTARIQSLDDGNYSSHLTFQTKQPGAPENALVEHLRIDSAGNVGIGTATPQSKLEIAAQDGLRVSGYQPFITLEDTNAANKCGYLQSTGGNLNFIPDSFHAQNSAAMVIENETGTVKVPGTVRANQFEGSGAGLTDIPAANITGKLSPAQLPSETGGSTKVSAADISGVLKPAQLPPISEISGRVTLDQIPTLPPSKISGAASQPVGPGGRPLLASGTINPGSTQNVYAIPMTDSAGDPLAGVYSLEIYTVYMWVAYTDVSAANIGAYNVMTRTVLAGSASIVGNNPLQIEPLSMGPTQTNHADPKFPAVTCSIISGTQQAWLQISTTAGDPTLTIPPSQFSTPLQYYVYSLM